MLRLVLACLALCFSYNIALAKYCVKLPSCEDLGYVFPYKEGRRQIRCPFDTDKVLYLDYCQAYGIQGKPDEVAGEYQECIEEKADGTKINTGYYRYTRCNVGYFYENGTCRTYQVGDIYYYNGTPIGVVFFNDLTTVKIVALNNINEYAQETKYYYTSWNNAVEATKKYAPSACSDESTCGKNKWTLPTIDELQTIYNNRSIISSSIIDNGGSVTYDYFWSSEEQTTDRAYLINFDNGGLVDAYKGNNNAIRPILRF